MSWETTGATTVYLKEVSGSTASTGTVDLSGSKTFSLSETTTFTLTATNSVGSTPAIITITVNPAAIVEQNMTIQPGGAQGKDSYVNSNYPDTNYGSLPYLNIGKIILSSMGVNKANYYIHSNRAYLQFELSDLPANSVIVNADLKLYQFNNSETDDFMIALHRVTESWDETTITFDNQPAYSLSSESTITITAGAFTWLSWDITTLLQGWLDASIGNYGIVLKDTYESLPNVSGCYSAELIPEPTLRPKIEITYYVP